MMWGVPVAQVERSITFRELQAWGEFLAIRREREHGGETIDVNKLDDKQLAAAFGAKFNG